MNITIDISSIPYGTGVSRYTSNLVSTLARQLKSDDILHLFGASLRQQSKLKHYIQSLYPDVHSHLRSTILPLPPKAVSFAINTLNLPLDLLPFKSDVFHSWDWYTPISHHVPIVTTIHDLSLFKNLATAHPQILHQHQQSLKRIERYAQAIIAVSQTTKQDILELTQIPDNKIHVIPEALPQESIIDLSLEDVIATQKKFGINQPYMLVVGTQEPRKNIPNMIQAWQENFSQDYQMVLAGRSAWDSIPDHANLIKTGYVDGKTLATLYHGASVFLYCSLAEGFGLPILEAFHYHVPVVTSRLSSMPEVAGPAASYVNNPSDPAEIAHAVKTALQQSNNLIQAGTQQLAHFSWDQVAAKTLNVYQSVVGD